MRLRCDLTVSGGQEQADNDRRGFHEREDRNHITSGWDSGITEQLITRNECNHTHGAIMRSNRSGIHRIKPAKTSQKKEAHNRDKYTEHQTSPGRQKEVDRGAVVCNQDTAFQANRAHEVQRQCLRHGLWQGKIRSSEGR